MNDGRRPEEYVASPGHGPAHCWNSDCTSCRPKLSTEADFRRTVAERKQRLKSDEWVDTHEYTEEERLTNLRIEGIRRRGTAR